MKNSEFVEFLESKEACVEGIEWVGKKTLATAWKKLDRSDWMLWLLTKLNWDKKIIVSIACDCAETALKYIPEGEARPKAAIDMARLWMVGGCTKKQINAATEAAADAARAAFAAVCTASAAASAASAAAVCAAYAAASADASAAASAACADASAACADASADYSFAASAAKTKMCNIIRRYVSAKMIEERIGEIK